MQPEIMFMKIVGCDIQITLKYSKPGLAGDIQMNVGNGDRKQGMVK